MEFKRLPLADRRRQTAHSHMALRASKQRFQSSLCVRMWKSKQVKSFLGCKLPAETRHHSLHCPSVQILLQWAWGTKAILTTHFLELAFKNKTKQKKVRHWWPRPHIKFSYFHYTNETVKWESKKMKLKKKSSSLGMEYWTCWFFLGGAQLGCLRKRDSLNEVSQTPNFGFWTEWVRTPQAQTWCLRQTLVSHITPLAKFSLNFRLPLESGRISSCPLPSLQFGSSIFMLSPDTFHSCSHS